MPDWEVELVVLVPYRIRIEAPTKEDVKAKVARMQVDDVTENATRLNEGRVTLGTFKKWRPG